VHVEHHRPASFRPGMKRFMASGFGSVEKNEIGPMVLSDPGQQASNKPGFFHARPEPTRCHRKISVKTSVADA